MIKRLIPKVLAAALSFVLLLQGISVAAAQTVPVGEVAGSNSEDGQPSDSQPAEILSEIPELREANVKHFLLDDGTYMAAMYDKPVHYDENGEWKDIDNTLQLQTAQDPEDVEGFVNIDNSVQIKLAKKADSDKLVKINQDDYQISWSYAGADPSVEAASASVQPLSMLSESPLPGTELTNVTSGLNYPNIEPGVDLQYVVNSTSLKENIVVKNKRDSYVFVLNLRVSNVTPVMSQTGGIDFINTQEETIFTIPAPFMTDASGAASTAVSFALAPGSEGQYALTITADSAWMNHADRSYPVTIDPVVDTTTGECSFIQVRSDTPNTNETDGWKFAVGQDDSGICRMYLQFAMPNLPSCTIITAADLTLNVSSGYGIGDMERTLDIYDAEIASNQSIHSITWNNQPSGWESGAVVDCNWLPESTGVTGMPEEMRFDVTRLCKKWQTSNSGLVICSSDESNYGYFHLFTGDSATEDYVPFLTLYYTEAQGLEDYWTYHTQELGKATASVNNYNGNLVVSHVDLEDDNQRMPYAVSHVYNLSKRNQPYAKYGSASTAYGLQTGKGFQLNVQQRMDAVTDSVLTSLSYRYVWLDGDGTQHYFKGSASGPWTDEDGLNLTLTKQSVGGVNYLYLEDKEGNRSIFNLDGRLMYITDSLPGTSTVTQRANFIRLYYSGNVLKYIYNPENQIIATFNYNSSQYLTQIKDASNRITSYTYDSNNYLTQITYPDSSTVKFSYFTGGSMYQLTGTDGRSLYFSGSSNGKVGAMTQRSTPDTNGNTQDGQKAVFTYTTQSCTDVVYTTGQGNTQHQMLTFDRYGRLINISDMNGENTNYTYRSYEEKDGNQVTSYSQTAAAAINLLNNSNCEVWSLSDQYNWIASSNNSLTVCSLSNEEAYLGNYSFKIANNAYQGEGGVGQRYNAAANTYYTLSGYVKGDSSAAYRSVLEVECYNSSGSLLETFTSGEATLQHTDWQRRAVTFQTPSQTSYIKVFARLKNYVGTVYFDCMQLEKGKSANAYNMLQNSDFQDVVGGDYPKEWIAGNCSSSDGDGMAAAGVAAPGCQGYRIVGNLEYDKGLSQEVVINKPADEIAFTVGATVSGSSLPLNNDYFFPEFGISVKVYYLQNNADGTVTERVKTAPLIVMNPDTEAYQTVSKVIRPSELVQDLTVTRVRMTLLYAYNRNHAVFYAPQLSLDETGVNYNYNNAGQLISATDNAGRTVTYSYDSATSNLLSVTDADNNQTNYVYSSVNPHQVVSIRRQGLDTSVALEYNNTGAITKGTLYSGTGAVGSVANTGKVTASSSTFNDGTTLATTTDPLGNTTMYTYSANRHLLEKVTDPLGNDTQYFYDNRDRLSSMIGNTDPNSASGEVVNDFTYDEGGRLSHIARDTSNYAYTYNQFGQRTALKQVQDPLLSHNLWTRNYYSGNGPVMDVIFPNNQKISYAYDPKDRLESISYNTVDTYQFDYDLRGNLSRVTDLVGGNTKVYYYDALNRVSDVIQGADMRAQYRYDPSNRLKQVGYAFDGITKTTSYHYDPAGVSDVILPGGQTVNTYYDTLGRKSAISNELDPTNSAKQWLEEYTYQSSTSGTQSGKVKLITGLHKAQYGVSLSYDYDANGNITHEYDAVLHKHRYYTYDGLNQLIREDDQIAGKTTLYSYNAAGNMTKREIYSYTTGTPTGTPQTIDYTYNTHWYDQMTQCGDQSVTYDDAGYPTMYKGILMNWQQGNQLGYTLRDGVFCYYEYDENGYRTKKTSKTMTNDIINSYEYMLDGNKIVAHKAMNGSITWFHYDPSGRPVALTDSFNHKYYYFYNAMGDVLGLYDENGDVAVRYAYDAWGKLLSVTDGSGNPLADSSDAGKAAKANPFRYRCYVYDDETGLYFLNGRYYDPETGRYISTRNDIDTSHGVIGTNLYNYCLNNPVNYSDPTGLNPTAGDAFQSLAEQTPGRGLAERSDNHIMDNRTVPVSGFEFNSNRLTSEVFGRELRNKTQNVNWTLEDITDDRWYFKNSFLTRYERIQSIVRPS